MITGRQLRAIMPHCRSPELWAQYLTPAMNRFVIVESDRIAAFLAQIAHESAELNSLGEILNYSAARLTRVWPKRFPSIAAAAPYANNPTGLANLVYANRLGNGSVSSGDGWKYRGRGLIMLTGRQNYALAAKGLDLPLADQPDLLSVGPTAALCAAWYWSMKDLNLLADDLPNDNDVADFIAISRKINGGLIGLPDRQKYWERAKEVLG